MTNRVSYTGLLERINKNKRDIARLKKASTITTLFLASNAISYNRGIVHCDRKIAKGYKQYLNKLNIV